MDGQGQPARMATAGTIVQIVKELTQDWDTEYSGGIQPETRLIGELAFESIDVVQLIAAIEEHYQRRDFPFEDLLMAEGRYVDEIRVADVAAFLDRHLGNGPAGQ
jgi:acyl carrier protein